MTDAQTVDAAPDAAAAPDPVQVTSRPTFTITEAAAACAVSRKTITRKLVELSEAGAAKDADGFWRIPVEALLSVGLHPGRSLPKSGREPASPVVDIRPKQHVVAAVAQKEPGGPVEDLVTIRRDRWDDLRIRLARAEAEAVERGRALDDARLALRALTAGPAAQYQVAAPPDPSGSAGSGGASERVPASLSPAPAEPTSTPVPTLEQLPKPADDRVWDTLLPRPPVAPAAAMAQFAPPPGHPSTSAQHHLAATPLGAGAYPPPPPMAPTAIPERPKRTRHWWGGRIIE